MILMGCGIPRPYYHYVGASEYQSEPWAEYVVWVDKNFGVEDKLAIDDAINGWNAALNGYVVIHVRSYEFDMEPSLLKKIVNSDNGWVILKIDSKNPILGTNHPNTLAFVNDIGGHSMWVIRDRIRGSWMKGIMLHEIGHLLGSKHTSKYLMQPYFKWELYQCVDYETLRNVVEAQHIPLKGTRYCVYE